MKKASTDSVSLPVLLVIALAHLVGGCERAPAVAEAIPEVRDVLLALNLDATAFHDSDTWYSLYDQSGERYGFVNGTMQRTQNGANFVCRSEGELAVLESCAITKRRFSSSSEYDGRSPFGLRSATVASYVSGQEVLRYEIQNESNEARVVVRTASGEARTLVRETYAVSLFDECWSRFWFRRALLRNGEKWKASHLPFETIEPQEVSYELVSTKQTHLGEPFYVCTGTWSDRPGSTSASWYDGNGELLIWDGWTCSMIRDTVEVAKSIGLSQETPIVGSLSVNWRCDRKTTIAGAAMRVTAPWKGEVRAGPLQDVTEFPEDGWVEIRTGSLAHSGGTGAEPAEIEVSLAPTLKFKTWLPEVVEGVRRLMAAARTEEERVLSILAHVAQGATEAAVVNGASLEALLDVGCQSAGQRSMLFVTLARRAGVPAREVFGFTFEEASQDRMSGGVWVEVNVRGQWVPVDCKRGEYPAQGLRIRCGLLTDLAARDWRDVDDGVGGSVEVLEVR